ncbi:diguanylate cyclase (GGDEF) domain-containing protein/HDIG domain-containing protein [Desulforamulus putei DSM 12395]|uniref:Diguanylate cyclase (GGDEF) domain-containing protein/HDIG domain-containing protein n=1 Tax=Desulforamulus putei DSM 12395 TaxID=1121429 RepID=A0A1M4URJ6_9FIRM|nr:diguanylate cyclase [Desulforamulus putei]SHE59309.1 diguanylate cyclase (GGDEF) domain-containing protein/HDIG domain-containing protein [Desulforamulus putei DSM 12395]
MNGWQHKREDNFRELRITIYLFCMIVFAIAILLKFNWNISANLQYKEIPNYIQHGLVLMMCLFVVLLGSSIMPCLNALSFGTLLLSILVFILIAHFHDKYLNNLLIIPVAFASFTKSKKVGCFIALGSGLLLCIGDIKRYGFGFPNRNLESDIILTGVMFICAWLIGGIAGIERDTRNYLLELANKDGLSGVYNHRYFQVYFKQAVEEAKNTSKPLSLFIFDIDFFKYYNDTFGHLAGDQILKDVGQILAREVIPPGIAARYGGDEFCVLLPEHDSKSAYIIAKKLKDKITESILNNENASKLPTGKLSVTVGVACYPEHTKSGEDLLELADQALYKAKKTSKDKIELYFNVLDTLKGSCDQSEMELLSSIKTLLSIINAKDRYTYGHSERVLEYATLLAKKYGLSEEEVRYVQYGAYLHDIGKIEVDISILNAPGKVTEAEWEILKQHPYWGSEIIRPIKSLEKVRPYILHHHENYDGTGYPLGLSCSHIPIGARIIRIADSFDAMTTDRPYKKGMSPEAACQELLSMAGSHYDPELCHLFVSMVKSYPDTFKIVTVNER